MGNIATLSDTTANAMQSAKIGLMNGGAIAIFAGPQPANANTPLSGNTLLVTLIFSSPAFNAPVAGSSTANAVQSGVAINSGIASFARIYQADGVTVVMDVSVGNPSANPPAYITLATTSIEVGGLTSVASVVDSCPEI